MQIQQQPTDTWSDAEVNQLLQSVDTIEAIMVGVEQHQINSVLALNIITGTTVALTTAVYALVLLSAIKFGYTIAHYFLPSPRDILS